MESKKFTAQAIQALRSKAYDAVSGDESERLDEGWTGPFDDPMAILSAFSPLGLKKGCVLKGYRYTSGGDGNGIVYAVRDSANVLSSADLLRQWRERTGGSTTCHDFIPKPKGARRSLMSVITGDGTPWSYLCASVLSRELAEYGARWHGVYWGAVEIVDSIPACDSQEREEPSERWTWMADSPGDLRPKVVIGTAWPTVTFCTYSAVGGEVLEEVSDTFDRGTYEFSTQQRTIARGHGGYVF